MKPLTHPAQVSEALGISFSAEQLAAIAAPLEPGVIIAGAGTGKTTVMAARVVWLVGSGLVRPEQVLGLTFTRKAASELSARIRRALATAGVTDTTGMDEAGEPVVLTYDAFAARLVADHGLRIGVDADARLITGAARFRLASRAVVAAPGPFTQLARLRPDSVVEKVLTLDGDLTAHLVDSEALVGQADTVIAAVAEAPRNRSGDIYSALRTAASVAAERVELAGLVDDFQRIKRTAGAVEFADQMAVAARLAREAPIVGQVLREQFAVVLLDEYQDTSSAQATLLQKLFSGDHPTTGRGHPVTAVGDPCQAIYGWRGAAAGNIIAFADTFPQADGRSANRYALTVNRRSGTTILAAANALATPLRQDQELQWDGIETDLVAPSGTAPGAIALATYDTWAEEVVGVVDRVIAHHDGGTVPHWSEIAILCRRNSAIRDLYQALSGRDVPVEIVGLDGLLQVPEVADVVAVLRVLDDAAANPDVVRILTGPRWAIGPQDLGVLGRRARELAGAIGDDEDELTTAEEIAALVDETLSVRTPSLVEALADPGPGNYSTEARARFAEVAAELAWLRSHAGAPVTELVRRVIGALGLEVECGLRGLQGRQQLDAFVAEVAGFAHADGDGSLRSLLSWIRAEEDHGGGLEQAVPTPTDSVKLLTIHKAKGLEWDLVVLPSLVDRVFPSERVQGNWLKASGVLPAELRGDAANVAQLAEMTDAAAKEYQAALKAEARRADDRLAYVAVTRARQQVLATAHTWSELIKPRALSPYLRTLESFADSIENATVSATNPLLTADAAVLWPSSLDLVAADQRQQAAAAVTRYRRETAVGDEGEPLLLDEAATVAAWDEASALLLAEARGRRRGLQATLPRYLSTTALMSLEQDAPGYLAMLGRPMPQPPVLSARVGERFHAWLERRFHTSPSLLGDLDAPAEGSDDTVAQLIAAFEQGPFADRVPKATEIPFSLFLGGHVLRGRIDAVFGDRGQDTIVDWKTGRSVRSNPLQLSVYRLAWAELTGMELDQVDALFYFVRQRRIVRPRDLLSRAELELLVQTTTDLSRR
ncbi:MAG: ATP-dependent DNA helicase [Propioniciclava sp.]